MLFAATTPELPKKEIKTGESDNKEGVPARRVGGEGGNGREEERETLDERGMR